MLDEETNHRYRIIDTAGSEVAIVSLDDPHLDEDAPLDVPGLGPMIVVEVYDDEDGREGGVAATIVVEEP